MIQGSVNLDLDTGFLFENPDSDAFLGEYISDPGDDDDDYTQNIGAFKAVLVAPAKMSKSDKWVHRYKLRNNRDVEKIVSIAFHEVVHSNLHRIDESNDHAHNHKFASMITNDLATAMRHASSFYKLAKFCADLYPMRGRGAAKAKKGAVRGRGYYSVKCEGRRGRPPKFSTLQAAREFIQNYQADYPHNSCTIFAHYRPETGDDIDVGWGPNLESFYRAHSIRKPLEERLSELRTEWDEDWRDSYRSGHDMSLGKDIFKRKRRSLRRWKH